MLKVEDDVADVVVGNAVKQVADIIFYLLCSLCVLYEDDSSFVLEEKGSCARVWCLCVYYRGRRTRCEGVRPCFSSFDLRKLFLSRTLLYPESCERETERGAERTHRSRLETLIKKDFCQKTEFRRRDKFFHKNNNRYTRARVE